MDDRNILPQPYQDGESYATHPKHASHRSQRVTIICATLGSLYAFILFIGLPTGIHCPPLPHPQHGQFFDDICDNAVNSACALLCDKGYEPVGDVIRLCLETGEWTGTELQCVGQLL